MELTRELANRRFMYVVKEEMQIADMREEDEARERWMGRINFWDS